MADHNLKTNTVVAETGSELIPNVKILNKSLRSMDET